MIAAGFVANGDSFAAGKLRVWAETRLGIPRFGINYDIAPDGKRLAAIVTDEMNEKLPTYLTFLLDFFDELRRKAPATSEKRDLGLGGRLPAGGTWKAVCRGNVR